MSHNWFISQCELGQVPVHKQLLLRVNERLTLWLDNSLGKSQARQ